MIFKKAFLASLFLGSIYVSTASASIVCEATSPTNFACEYTDHQIGNTYTWTTSGQIGISGGGGPFRFAYCNFQPATGSIIVTVHHPNNPTSSYTSTLACSKTFHGGFDFH